MDEAVSAHITNVGKQQLAAQLEFVAAVNNQLLESLARLFDAHVHATRDAMAASTETVQRMFSPEALSTPLWPNIAAQSGYVKELAYGRQLNEIATDARTACTHLVQERIGEINREYGTLFNELTKNAPPGAQNALEAIRKAGDNATTAMDNMVKTSEQAIEAMTAKFEGKVGSAAPVKSTTSKMRVVSKRA